MTAKTSDLNIHTTLTLDERDCIDRANGRALRLLGVVSNLFNSRENLEDDIDEAAVLDILDVIQEDLTKVTATLSTGDNRRAVFNAEDRAGRVCCLRSGRETILRAGGGALSKPVRGARR